MTSLLATASFLAHDIATGAHTVVLDWHEHPELHYDAATGCPVGLALPVRCLDCMWNHTAFLDRALTQQAVDIAVADMSTLHNDTRPKDGSNA